MSPEMIGLVGMTILFVLLGLRIPVAFAMFAVGLIPIVRFLIFYAMGDGGGHVQSLVIGGSLLICGYMSCLVALLSDVVATNRRLEEEIIVILRRMEHDDMRNVD